MQSATLKVAHSTLLVVCSLIAAQMPAYLSLEDNERLLRHDMCYMFIISIKMMYTCFFCELLEASCLSHSASLLSWLSTVYVHLMQGVLRAVQTQNAIYVCVHNTCDAHAARSTNPVTSLPVGKGLQHAFSSSWLVNCFMNFQ